MGGLHIFILIFGTVAVFGQDTNVKIYEFSRNVSLSIPGKRLIGHVIEEFSTKKQLIHCAYECLKTSRCRSYNYEHETHTCQINDADHVTNSDSLVNETESEYNHRDAFSIDQVTQFHLNIFVNSLTTEPSCLFFVYMYHIVSKPSCRKRLNVIKAIRGVVYVTI